MRCFKLSTSMMIGLGIVACWLCPRAQAQYLDTDIEAEGDENPYDTKGTVEFGGSVATSWVPSMFRSMSNRRSAGSWPIARS